MVELILDIEAIRQSLEAERAMLLDQSQASEESRATVELDQQSVGRLSRVDALQAQAMAKSQESRRLMRLQRIDAALKRLGEGNFGYCLSCGDDISPDRLKIDPTVTICVQCAER